MRIVVPGPFAVANTCSGAVAGVAFVAAWRGSFLPSERVAILAISVVGCIALVLVFVKAARLGRQIRREVGNVNRLLAEAEVLSMSDAELEAQRRSFAHGNVSLSNPDVTREVVDRAAEDLNRERHHG